MVRPIFDQSFWKENKLKKTKQNKKNLGKKRKTQEKKWKCENEMDSVVSCRQIQHHSNRFWDISSRCDTKEKPGILFYNEKDDSKKGKSFE